MTQEPTLVLGYDTAPVRELGQLLGGRLEIVPGRAGDHELERWRRVVAAGTPCGRIVVALWNDPPEPEPFREIGADAWHWRSEAQFIAWAIVLGAASLRCAEGGSIVAVAEAPAALDAAGLVVEAGLACGVGALVKSLAFSEGTRSVRVNAVTTSTRLSGPHIVAPAPPLASFPGRLDREVVGAVRLLLSEEAVGLTGRILAADCGRSP